MKTIYLTGAGFSKEININYPTLLELTEIIYSCLKEKYFGKAILFHFESLPDGCKSDIEQLLTYISIEWPWKNSIEKYMDMALFKAIEIEINNYFLRINETNIEFEYIELIRNIHNNDQSILTFNYDTLIEHICSQNLLNKSTEYCGYEIIIEDIYEEHKMIPDDKVYLIIEIPKNNRFRNNKQIRFKREYLNKVSKEEIDEFFTRTIGKVWTTNSPSFMIKWSQETNKFAEMDILKLHGGIKIKKDLELSSSIGLIPPTLDKSFYYNNKYIKDLWERGHDLIKETQSFFFIGFSFPISDLAVRFLFQSALMSNPKCEIVVVNQGNKSEVESKYTEIFKLYKVKLNFNYCGIEKPLKSYINENILFLKSQSV